jgi:hypothetical protein
LDSEPDKEKKGFPGCGGFAVYLIAAILAITLISGAISAYADGIDAGERKGEYDSTIDSLKVKLDRETKEAINNLDPDYRRAVAERDRGVLAPGEELLPVYDDE